MQPLPNPPPSLNFNHLRLFDAVAEEASVSRAARRLRISQPAVTKQVRQLEAMLGTPLLERLPRGVRLTAAGALLADYTRRLFALADEAAAALAELGDLRRGRLRLGASMTIGVYLIPAMLAGWRARWPGVAVECAIENTDAIQKSLVDHSLDLGLTEGPGPLEAQLESRLVAWDKLIVVAAPGTPERLGLADIAALPWVMREPGSGTRAVVDAALARRGLAITPAWTFNNPEAIKQAVMAGCGVAMVPRLAVGNELARGQLRRLRVPGLALRRPLRLQWMRGRPQSAAMRAFAAYCGPGPK